MQGATAMHARVHLIRFHGLLALNAMVRAQVALAAAAQFERPLSASRKRSAGRSLLLGEWASNVDTKLEVNVRPRRSDGSFMAGSGCWRLRPSAVARSAEG